MLPHPQPGPAAIREQLERILRNPAFRNSQRYPAFLRYCVDRTLEQQTDSLKERTIGVEVFGRSPDYDTATDHVVRSAAGEIRKRLAQYYQEPSAAGEIRIDLFSGSYVPQFSFPPDRPAPSPDPPPAPLPLPRSRPRLRRGTLPAALLVVTALIALAVWTLRQAAADNPIGLFWNPVLESPGRATLCVGERLDAESGPASPDATVLQMHQLAVHRIHFASAVTLAKLTALLEGRGKSTRILLRSATRFSDLQEGASVLIGGYNNDWTLRLTNTLRYGFEGSPDQSARIRDREHPERNDWSVDYTLPYRKLTRDYALVCRLRDPKTEQTTVIVAGIGYWGTLAAGDFITDAAHLRKLQAAAPKGWQHMNLEVVLSTDVIDGISGPPKVVATHFW